VLLTLFTRGHDVTDGVTHAFTGGVAIAAVAVVLGLLIWYGPGRRAGRRGDRAASPVI
jgi:membrane protein DedA with SNARE-associated domain